MKLYVFIKLFTIQDVTPLSKLNHGLLLLSDVGIYFMVNTVFKIYLVKMDTNLNRSKNAEQKATAGGYRRR